MGQVPVGCEPEEIAYLKFKIPLFYCYLILALSPPVHSDNLKLEIISLQYRDTSEVIPIIRPFIGGGGTVTGMNNQLIIKAAPEDIATIKQLLVTIDKKPRRLMITVTHEISDTKEGARQSIAGRYATGNLNISAGNTTERGTGGGVGLQGGETGNIRYRLNSSRSTEQNNSDLRVQTLEGQPAFIESGNQVPLTNRTAYHTRQGVVVQDTVEYHNATTGFYVIPNLSGDMVTLSISPFMTQVSPGHTDSFDIENVETTVQGRLGEWIEIGGYQLQNHREESGLLSQQRRQQGKQHAIYLKVEELN